VDVTGVSAATTFTGLALGFPLAFGSSNVAMYNDQGFLMQLLDPNVPGLFQIAAGDALTSTALTYWRHEFETYKQAHRQLDAFNTDDDPNWHADGTPHVNHNLIVVAIRGRRQPRQVRRPRVGRAETREAGLVPVDPRRGERRRRQHEGVDLDEGRCIIAADELALALRRHPARRVAGRHHLAHAGDLRAEESRPAAEPGLERDLTLDGEHRQHHGQNEVVVREPDVDDTRPERREPVARRRICRVDRGVGLRAERVAARADAEAVDARLEVLEEIGDGPRPRVRVGGIEPRNRLRDDGRVADRARQRPRHGERGVAATGVAAIADEAEGGLEADDAAERRGDAGRSTAVGADVERAHQRG